MRHPADVANGIDTARQEPANTDDEDVFIIRVRMETIEDEGDPKAMRGRVEHLPTRKSRYFRDFETLVQFLISNLWT